MTIYCVGKNYAKHAAEMGGQTPSQPMWFLKPDASIIGPGEAIQIPPGIGEVHHEVELALRIGADGRPDAMTVAIDVTARDLQAKAKAAGKPWTQAKGYRTFCALGEWVDCVEPDQQHLRLGIDGDVRQDGHTSDMTFNVNALLDHAATWTDLRAGDIILTGTPEGVGPMQPGQRIRATLEGHVDAVFDVVSA